MIKRLREYAREEHRRDLEPDPGAARNLGAVRRAGAQPAKAYREIGSQISIPGFRKGKVPTAVLDQRVGRETILSEAVQEAIPAQILAAVREHEVQTLGRPEVEITDFSDGNPLKFTAEVDVRPEVTVPDPSSITITVDDLEVSDDDVASQLDGLRQRFATLKTVERPAANGDFVQIDLLATVDGEEVPGGTATNLSHEVGSNQLLPGLDEAIVGLAAGTDTTFTSNLVAGDLAGQEADVSVTVRSVRERELPPLDDEFAGLASEFDTLDELRADLVERLSRVKKVERLYAARDRALEALVAASDVPAPEGVVRDEVASRKESMVDQLERMGASMEDYLASEGKTEEDLDADLNKAAAEGVKIQLLMDAFADKEQIDVTNDEFGHEIVHRAQRAGMSPQQYYDQILRAGNAAAVFADVRRGKALSALLERVTIIDSAGNPVPLDDLRVEDDHSGHNHGDDDHDDE